ncbi:MULTISPECIES: sulfatase [unclassified Nocardioides]|uniref:sulfatase family protein n=1 Tax=unclassified Nocardioides TaxID=2615069 RepID=UPI00361CA93A
MADRGVTRRTALAGGIATGAAALAPWPGASSTAGSRPRPNILVIMTDDQPLESMRVMTNVQRLIADQGTTFTNSFANWPVCSPSRATLLTGQYAHHHGVFGNEPPYGGVEKLDQSNTVAVWLQQAGYHTAMLGKYINHYDEVGRADPSQIPPGWSDWQVRVSGDGFRNTVLNENGTLVSYQGQYQTDVYAEKAVDIVQRAATTGKPFFAWINFFAPHFGTPREPDDPGTGGDGLGPAVADRHRDAFASEPLPRPPSFNEADVSDKPRHIRNRPLLSDAVQAASRERYQQQLESLLAVDEAVGQLLDALDATGQADNTLVVFTSDNGHFHGEHRIPSEKFFLYDPASRVPLILRGPGIPAGETRTQLVSNVDLAPTFAQAGRATPELAVDGISLLPLARDPRVAHGRPVLLEGHPRTGENLSYAIRTPRYQYTEVFPVDGGTPEVELYDVRLDPDQLGSRHDDPRYAEVRVDLARQLTALKST